MQKTHFIKTLSLAALVSMSLLSGVSQAHEWGRYENASMAYFPERGHFDHADFDRHAPDAYSHREAAFDIDARQQSLMNKIMHGLQSGSLSRREAEKLLQEQREIEQLQRQYLSDRRFSRNEWEVLDRRLDRAAREIRAEMRDQNWR